VDQGASYRLISLLCPAVKILERLLLPLMTSAFPASPTQHSFRQDRSTITALLPLISQISEGFNCRKPAKRSAAVTIDISKAFNTVNIILLLQQIAKTDLHHNIVRWLSSYLRGKSAGGVYQGAKSKFRLVHVGVPQGSVLSPCLFNLFTSDFPAVNDLLVSFADNFMIAATDVEMAKIETSLNQDLKRISRWARRKQLKISATKSQVTHFTPWNGEKENPQIFFEEVQIPVEGTMKILGINCNRFHTMTPQIKESGSKSCKRVPMWLLWALNVFFQWRMAY
jgi:hypothetical protein